MANSGDIPSNITLGADQAIRRNASDTAFEAFTPSSGGSVSDVAYGVSWDGNTTDAPSKNAVYDKIESMSTGSLTITETEVDFGTTPTTDALFTITDAGVSATSKIIVQASGKPATGRVAGDDQWDSITYSANPGTGSFSVYAKASGSVVGKRKIHYTVA